MPPTDLRHDDTMNCALKGHNVISEIDDYDRVNDMGYLNFAAYKYTRNRSLCQMYCFCTEKDNSTLRCNNPSIKNKNV